MLGMKQATTVIPIAESRRTEAAAITVPAWKRMLDVAVTVAALPILIPIAAAIAVLIKCVSRGPVLFRQERIGFCGKSFVCFKFRTMRVDAPTMGHQQYFQELMRSDRPMIKLDCMGDRRLIPLGSVLRATGLDELPQFFNVLKGEMSVVGPRPCLSYEYERYLPRQKGRFNSLPGITGLWQVNGKNNTTFDQMIEMDIQYATSKSLGLDLKIMLKTFPTLALQVAQILRKRLKPSKRAEFPSRD